MLLLLEIGARMMCFVGYCFAFSYSAVRTVLIAQSSVIHMPYYQSMKYIM